MLRGYFDLILDCWKITVFMNKSINIHYVGTYLRPWYHHPYTHWIIQPTCFQFGCGWKYSLLVDVTTRYILYKVCHKHKRAGKLKNRLSGWESILRPLPDPFKILIVSDNWQAFTIWKCMDQSLSGGNSAIQPLLPKYFLRGWFMIASDWKHLTKRGPMCTAQRLEY